jgi:acetyltransferase-like isoleucine patch superfamily enzyme
MDVRYLAARLMYPNNCSSEAYIKYLRKMGCHIGEHTFFFAPRHNTIDTTRPYLLYIGDYCKITQGVVILTHDYSRSVLRMEYKEIIEDACFVHIGDNVFIGINAIILKGATIGNNVIIGAGSVVSHDIPDNTVAAGNPAKVVMTLDEYYQKRKERFILEAKEYAREIYRRTAKYPTIKDMADFYPLYLRRDLDEIKKHNLQIAFSGDNYQDTVKSFLDSKPVYKNFEEFLKDCGFGQIPMGLVN